MTVLVCDRQSEPTELLCIYGEAVDEWFSQSHLKTNGLVTL